jgi:predicted secreted hydrolase
MGTADQPIVGSSVFRNSAWRRCPKQILEEHMFMTCYIERSKNKDDRFSHRVARTLRLGVFTKVLAACFFAAVLTHPASAQTVSLPKDEAPHTDLVEWYYFVGHLQGVDPAGKQHTYGYQMTTFQVLQDPAQPALYVTNVAITDDTRGAYDKDSQTTFAPVPQEVNSFNLSSNAWNMQGGSGKYSVNAALSDQNYAFTLKMQSAIPAALHGVHGQIPYGPLGTSAYYSYTALATQGTIIDHGVPIAVTGISWQDHQWGNYDLTQQIGWTWFGIQLGSDSLPGVPPKSSPLQYMLYFIQDYTGAIVQVVATQIKNGVTTAIPANQVSQKALTTYTSPATDFTYGTSWLVTVPGGSFIVNSRVRAQEFVGAPGYQSYYEGDALVFGALNGEPVSGVAFAEVNPFSQQGQLLP